MNKHRLIPVKLDEYKPLRDVVFESLRDAIIKETLKPGERLMEVQLAEEMGVSRTPVREAIHKLVLEGYAVVSPRRGVQVARISPEDLSEVYEIRAELESLACGLAAERATKEEIEEMEKALIFEKKVIREGEVAKIIKADFTFHNIIYKASRNERLRAVLTALQEQVYRVRLTSITLMGRSKKSQEDHRRIVESIFEREAELAQQLASEHIESAYQVISKYLKG